MARAGARCRASPWCSSTKGSAASRPGGTFPPAWPRPPGRGPSSTAAPGTGAPNQCRCPRPLRFMHDEALLVLARGPRRGRRPRVRPGRPQRRRLDRPHPRGGRAGREGAGSDRRGAPRLLSRTSRSAASPGPPRATGRAISAGPSSAITKTTWTSRSGAGTGPGWIPPFATGASREYLPRIECPVLVIQGEGDEYGTLAQIDAIEAGCGGPVRRLVLPACGHSPHREQPDVVLAAMAEFVRGVGGAP